MKRFFNERLGLGPTIALASALLAFVLTAVLAEFIGHTVGEETRRQIGDSLRDLATQGARRLDRGMFERYREMQILAQSRLSVLAQGSQDQQRRLIDLTQQTFPFYAWIGLAGLDGRVQVASKGMLEGQDVSQRPWFGQALSGTYLMDLHEAKLLARLLPANSGEPQRFLDIAFPVPGKDGEPRAVLGAHLSWTWAREVRQSIIEAAHEKRGVEMLIAGRDGTVLLGPADVQGKEMRLPSLREAQQKKDGYRVEQWADGRNYLVGYSATRGYASYPGLGWLVLVRQDLDAAYAPVRELQRRILGAGLLVATLFSLAGFFVARGFTRPLERVAQGAHQIENGEIVQIQDQHCVYREVGVLTRSLNSLVGKLRQNEAALREANATLERKVEERTAQLHGALERVLSSQARIAAILASSPDAFVALGMDGRITDWNARAQEMFGYSRQEALGQDAAGLLVPQRLAADFRKGIAHYASGKAALPGRLEHLVRRRDSHEFPVETTVGLARDNDQPFLSAFLHDISDRKKIEQMKDQFVSTVSHELRTPLTSIRMSLDMLQDMTAGTLESEAAQILSIAHESCERLVRLINDILDLEKISAGHLELQLAPLPLASLLQQAARNVEGFAHQHQVKLALALPAADAVIHADQDRMLQVLINLLSNAIKFSPAGKEVALSAQTLDQRWARILVRDHGSGIPEEFRSRIFTRFAQADATDTRKKGGTGLGLAICKELVEAQHGRIAYQSEEDRGTCFTVDMPLESQVQAAGNATDLAGA